MEEVFHQLPGPDLGPDMVEEGWLTRILLSSLPLQ